MEFDTVLALIGDFGRYQKFIFFLLCLVCLPAAFNQLSIVFLAGVPDHRCAIPDIDKLTDVPLDVRLNITLPKEKRGTSMKYSQCEMYQRNYTNFTVEDLYSLILDSSPAPPVVKCTDGWVYSKKQYTSTVVMEWDLVCDRGAWQTTVESVYMAGLMVGCFIFGPVADRFGRRPTLLIGTVLMFLTSLGNAFVPEIISFTVMRFLLAMFSISIFTVAFVVGMEIVGPSWRVFTGLMVMEAWAVGFVILAGIAYGIRDWFVLQLVITAPISILSIYFCLLPESPRWLFVAQKSEKAKEILRKIASKNGTLRNLPKDLHVNVKQDRPGNVVDLIRTTNIRKRSLNLFFIWCVNSVVYYGITLNTSNLAGDMYINFFISGAVEIPAYVWCYFVLHKFGRRLPLGGCMLVGGISLLCTIPIPEEYSTITVVLSMIGKFAISSSFSIVYVFTAELYPTCIRSIGVSLCSVFARVGGILAPILGDLGLYTNIDILPIIIFGTLSVIAGVLCFLLPETKDVHLPETLDDGERFGQKLLLESESDTEKSQEEVQETKSYGSLEPSKKPMMYETNC